jgi:hypothetical protein
VTIWSEVVDWDVGLYLAVAREVLHGHLPYVTAWEYRPPGLFLLLAGALGTFRTPAAAMAALGIAAVCATSLALYGIGRAFGATGRTIGLVAALLYAMGAIEDDGLAANTEILFAPFVCWAVALVLRSGALRERVGLPRGLLIGALCGAALQMKLTVGVDVVFVLALLLWWARAGVGAAAAVAGMTALPFAVEAAVYAAQGALGALLDANWFATLRRASVSTTAPRDNLPRILAQPTALFPAWLLALFAPLVAARDAAGDVPRRLVPMLWLWFGVEAATLVAIREFNDHQFLMLLPPLAVLAAYAAVTGGARLGIPRVAVTLVLLLAFALHGYYAVLSGARLAYHRVILHDAAWREANLDRLAAAIRRQRGDGTLFVVGETPILYLLADAPLPTRLPFSLYLTDPEMWPLTNVDGRREVARILEERPDLIVRSDSRFHLDPQVGAEVSETLRAEYRPVATFEHDTLYERAAH